MSEEKVTRQKLNDWKSLTIISEIAQENVDMWSSYKEASKAEFPNQHVLRSLTKTTASALTIRK
jgi:hypothetical protein